MYSKHTNRTGIKNSVRQCCILAPLLFNIYAKYFVSEALTQETARIIVNGKPINNIIHVDYIVLQAKNINDLQHIVQKASTTCLKYNLNMNLNKTNILVFSKKSNTNIQPIIDNKEIDLYHNQF